MTLNESYSRYRIEPEVLDKVKEEYEWLSQCTLIREMIQVKKRECNSLQELSRNVVRKSISTSLTYNQVPRVIPYGLRRVVALPEIYSIPL